MTVSNQNYVSARIKKDTYKNLKQLALDLNMPLTQVFDFLYNHYQKQKADAD
ncbi:MAG: hypothetical protein WC856_07925 [Methylococcaceae bacterium]|jgi:hypothetical protein